MVAEVIENNEHGSDIDPMAFPWDQNARHIYGFVYIVNLTNPETFDTMKDFIDKISQIERDRRKDQFVPKKIIVGTMAGKLQPIFNYFFPKIHFLTKLFR